MFPHAVALPQPRFMHLSEKPLIADYADGIPNRQSTINVLIYIETQCRAGWGYNVFDLKGSSASNCEGEHGLRDVALFYVVYEW
jgi:hypothetical protein